MKSLDLKPEDWTTYKGITGALEKHFVTRKNIIFERAQFHTRKQMPGESIDQYIKPLYKVFDSCDYPAGMRSEMLEIALL